MKKIFTLFAAVMFVASCFAQMNVQAPKGKKMSTLKGVEKNVKSVEEGWFSYAYFLENYWGEEIERGSGNYLQMDTNGLVKFGDTWSNPWIMAVSQTYDFNADFFDMATPEGEMSMTYTNSFTIDSIQIPVMYIREESLPESVVDTLIVGIVTGNIEDIPQYSYTAYDNSCFLYFEQDPATGLQRDATIYKLPLTADMVSQPVPDQEGYFYLSNLELAINQQNIQNKVWNIAYTYKRGYDCGLNDTLLSHVTFSTWKDPQANYSISGNNSNICENLSHSGFIAAFTNGVVDYFYPGFAFGEDMHYPYLYVKVSCDDCAHVDVKDIEKENITVYPNPATNNFTVQLAGDEKANIQLFNLVGQQVYSETASNVANVNVSNLNAGVYMLKVSQNGKVYTSKVIVK